MTCSLAAIVAVLAAWPVADPQSGAETQVPPPAAAQLPLPDAAALVEQYRPKLAEAWLREVVLILGSPTVTPENFEPALDLAAAAAAMTPDDPEAWRVALIAAQLCAPGVPHARKLEHEAVARIVKLDPSDQVSQFLRLTQVIDSFDTAEQRLAAYRKLLTPESRQTIGPAMSARLAFEMALLQSRTGDIDGFAKSLAEAVSLDPAFPAATEMAAGFFAGRVNDIGAAAELLIAAIVANPTRLATYMDVGAVLMSEGAYRSAVRIFRLALLVNAERSVSAANDITCDLAMAQWGSGDSAAALVTIRQRIQWMDERHRRMLARTNPDMPQRELEQTVSPLSPLMATIYAALARSTKAPEAEKAIARLALNFKALAEDAVRAGEQGTIKMAGLMLEMAWATLILGSDPSLVPEMVQGVHKLTPLEEDAHNRFAGWQRLRIGDVEGALTVLRPLAEKDPMARLGFGEALIASGDVRDGAREVLAVANAERGTALGLFAADRIQELVGARPAVGSSAAALDAAVAELPQGFDRAIESSAATLSLTIVPEKETYGPFERVRFKVTLSNRSALTLAIDSQGPIMSQSACSVSISAIGARGGDLPPAIIPIDRRLQLAPLETMTFIYDASITDLGAFMTANPLKGLSATARCVVNFIPRDPRVTVGFMGREALSAPIRINGMRTDAESLERAWASLRTPGVLPDPVQFALMGHFLATQENQNDPASMQALVLQWQELAAMWKRYPPLVQSWLIMVMPSQAVADKPLLEVMRESIDPMVITSFLLRRVTTASDSMLDVARRNPDARLSRLADGVQRAMERKLDERQREFGLTEQNP